MLVSQNLDYLPLFTSINGIFQKTDITIPGIHKARSIKCLIYQEFSLNIPMLVHLVIDYFANIGLIMEGFNHKIIDSIVIPSL